MLVQNEIFLDKVLDAFASCYDIERIESSVDHLYATAEFHQTMNKYVLFKNAKLWEVKIHEYVYFFNVSSLTIDNYEVCLHHAYESGMKRIIPDKNHMYSYITLVLICNDVASQDAVKKLKRCHIHKDFKLSFHGWMDVRTVLVNKGTNMVQTNHMGKDLRKLFQKLL